MGDPRAGAQCTARRAGTVMISHPARSDTSQARHGATHRSMNDIGRFMIPPLDAAAEIENGSAWLREQLRRASHERVVIGLSGGIDSAVTATWACRALGPGSVTLVSMPYGLLASSVFEASTLDSVAHARRVAAQLPGVDYRELDIATTVDGGRARAVSPEGGLTRHQHLLRHVRCDLAPTALPGGARPRGLGCTRLATGNGPATGRRIAGQLQWTSPLLLSRRYRARERPDAGPASRRFVGGAVSRCSNGAACRERRAPARGRSARFSEKVARCDAGLMTTGVKSSHPTSDRPPPARPRPCDTGPQVLLFLRLPHQPR